MGFQSRLKKLRLNKKLTQQDVANMLGITRQAYGYYESETSKREPDLATVNRLAEIFDVSTDYLLGRTNIPKDTTQHNNDTYDSLAEINKLVKKYGIGDMGFFDIEKWKNLSPEDVRMIEEHFKMIVKLAKERNEKEK